VPEPGFERALSKQLIEALKSGALTARKVCHMWSEPACRYRLLAPAPSLASPTEIRGCREPRQASGFHFPSTCSVLSAGVTLFKKDRERNATGEGS
jgi:hypothetical protein